MPLRIENRQHCINLLYLSEIVRQHPDGRREIVPAKEPIEDDGCKYEFKSHYAFIKNLSRLFNSETLHEHSLFVCPYCLHRCSTEQRLNDHIKDCSTNKPCRITFPSKKIKVRKGDENEEFETLEEHMGIDAAERRQMQIAEAIENGLPPENILLYKDQQKEMPLPFVLYADFESFIDNKGIHTPSGFCTLLVSSIEKYNKETAYVYSGPDPMAHFFDHLTEVKTKVKSILSNNVSMKKMTSEEEKRHAEASSCGVCGGSFNAKNLKVRHHCHITGNYLAAACNNCNLKLKPRKMSGIGEDQGRDFFIPVFFHNLRGYDSHLIIKALTKKIVDKDEIRVIANSTEKFISFQIGGLRFLDTLQFLNASLDSSVKVLTKSGSDSFVHTRRHFIDSDKFKLMTQKGIYPYEFMNSCERFGETVLPPIDAFFSKLSDSCVSDEDYERAKKVWSTFSIENMQDYHDLYLKTDVLLLADVFENFRKLTMTNYGLDAAHYYTVPGLTMSAGLKYTGVHLELLTDHDMLLMFEKGLRGGISTIVNRFGTANNPLVPGYDPSKPTKYLMYLDMNNLYGHALRDYLPISGFRFLQKWEIDRLIPRLTYLSDENEKGYMLEVDLEYPSSLHDAHNDYPLAAEHVNITENMLSPYAKELLDKLGKKPPKHNEKLLPNLMNKQNYVLHYRLLKFYLNMGLKLTKVHRVIEFNQSRWLAPYIDFNTQKRTEATTEFEKNLYKLCNNAIFGKMCEDLRKRTKVHLVTEQVQAERYVAKPTYDSFKIINSDVTMVKLTNSEILWNKPTFIGSCVLELSKLAMYEFHYNYIVKEYTESTGICRAKLLFTDTDSLCYEIQTNDVYEDMRKRPDLFDTSDYPSNHPNHSMSNCKVVGKMKDECAVRAAVQFVGLRSKMYSLLLADDDEKSTAKGVKRSHAQQHIRHNQYYECLVNEAPTSESFHILQSSKITQYLQTKRRRMVSHHTTTNVIC